MTIYTVQVKGTAAAAEPLATRMNLGEAVQFAEVHAPFDGCIRQWDCVEEWQLEFADNGACSFRKTKT